MNLTFDFAFEGFRLIRERPKLIAFWGALTLLWWGAMWGIMVAMAGPALATLMKMTSYDPQVIQTLTEQLLPALGVCAPIYVVMSSILVCAICRASMGQRDDRFGFLKLGMDEIRMMGVRGGTLLTLAGVFIGFGTVGSLFAALVNASSPQAAAAAQSLSSILALGTFVWLSLRLSLNNPQSFESQRINLFGSFSMTQDRFWSLFTGYAAAMALALVVQFLCDKIIEAVQVLSLGLKVTGDMVPPDPTTLTSFLSPASLIYFVLSYAIVAPLTSAIQFGAPVAAYKILRGKVALLPDQEAAR
ncbi:hypothetical protein [Asticcacaulis benevestitus]|uniref:Glycerophosphoryl diester phosphodiesterase membrane domain-containing protein n=1 Tax=Asticcacaulis benevestitus DSM 16100 = ATCC BAA-896 TaxID=1121022 RepID=V4Q2Q6_9CAUL|nr:hypothetical protein [Asticcacaulis benevestitus]ESQ93984.1 hypothetical protein ABENE_04655 [Asticcacaulis benevestitus DSM 16100 = ATCC BAA-896]